MQLCTPFVDSGTAGLTPAVQIQLNEVAYLTDRSCILGIDIGTTSAKAVVFQENGKVLAKSEAQLELIIQGEAEYEQDPYQVDEKITGVILNTLYTVKQNGYSVRLVSFSAAMHSLLPVNEDGTPLHHALTWLDGRAHREAEKIWQTKEGRQVYGQPG